MPQSEQTDRFSPCAVIPSFNNPETVGEVVREVARYLPVFVVDDGSDPLGAKRISELGKEGIAKTYRRQENGGKGAAVRDGLRIAESAGYSHALQIDADGQHAIADLPRFLEMAREHPQALILGAPEYDESAPASRKWGRQITIFWTNLETGGSAIRDPMCGFRVYPLKLANQLAPRCGARMDFDIEIAVRMVWEGCEVQNLSTKVIYPPGGVSSFRLIADNLRISWMHTRLVCEGLLRSLGLGRGKSRSSHKAPEGIEGARRESAR